MRQADSGTFRGRAVKKTPHFGQNRDVSQHGRKNDPRRRYKRDQWLLPRRKRSQSMSSDEVRYLGEVER
jgi:hypothetical protein